MPEKKRKLIKVTEHFVAERRVQSYGDGPYRYFTQLTWRDSPDDENGRDRISVAAGIGWGEPRQWEPAEINWSAIGAVPAPVAEEFGKALLWAAREANRIDKLTGVQTSPKLS